MVKYYAVHRGRQPGVFDSWRQCKRSIGGVVGPIYKVCKTRYDAEHFVQNGRMKYYEQLGEFRNEPKFVTVYADGCCRGNGQPDARGGVGVYYPNGEFPDVFDNLSEYIGYDEIHTNQKAELIAMEIAIANALRSVGERARGVRVHTDSQFAINCLTVWCKNWKRNGWKNSKGLPVANKEIIQRILGKIRKLNNALLQMYFGYGVQFVKLDGHSDDPGNDEADALANQGAIYTYS